MATTVQIDDKQFNRKMAQYVDRLGHEAVDVVRTQARLLFTQVVKFTPPRKSTQGKAAVERDVRRAMFPLEIEDAKTEGFAKAVRSNDLEAINAIIHNSGGWKGWEARHFDKGLHERARDRRGRVRRRQKIYVPEAKRVRGYIREKKRNVGMAKGAWTKALEAVGGKVPSWARRAGEHHGRADTSRLRNTRFPSITGLNQAASSSQTRRPLANAIRVRIGKMENDVRQRLRKISRRLRLQ